MGLRDKLIAAGLSDAEIRSALERAYTISKVAPSLRITNLNPLRLKGNSNA